MKVQDQMSGIKAAAGHPILHCGLFFATLFITKSQTCGEKSYREALILLCISHGFNAARLPLQLLVTELRIVYFSKQFGWDLIDRFTGFVGVMLQLWAIIAAQDAYFFQNTSDCDEEDIGVSRGWVFVEICVFYLSFVSTFFFILISNFKLRETGIMFQMKKEHRVDFLTKYDTLNGLFQSFFLMIGATAVSMLE